MQAPSGSRRRLANEGCGSEVPPKVESHQPIEVSLGTKYLMSGRSFMSARSLQSAIIYRMDCVVYVMWMRAVGSEGWAWQVLDFSDGDKPVVGFLLIIGWYDEASMVSGHIDGDDQPTSVCNDAAVLCSCRQASGHRWTSMS